MSKERLKKRQRLSKKRKDYRIIVREIKKKEKQIDGNVEKAKKRRETKRKT
jgi:vacuolar-type H+-ATPase subunit H